MSPTSLDGIRVLDLSRVLAGPWSTQTLGDLGADVIKVERPGTGDDTRSWGPPFMPVEIPATTVERGEAAYYLSTNRNKRSLTCDIAQAAGQALIRELVAHCDIFVENFKVGDMARYGLDYARLQEINPRLVYCSISGFGQTGPHSHKAGYDYAIQAMGGLLSITGDSDAAGGGPQKVGVAVADLFAGMYATVAILAALRHAERSGAGQHIDLALLDAQIAMLANLGANYHLSAAIPQRLGNAHANIVPYQIFEVAAQPSGARDHIVLAVGNDHQFGKFCAVAGHPQLAQDARFSSNAGRVRQRHILVPMLEKIFLQHGKAEWLELLQAAQVPCSAINDIGEVFADPQIAARGLLDDWQHPQAAHLPLTASPLHLSRTPVRSARAGGRPPPLLGQHSQEILHEVLGYSVEQIEKLRQSHIV